jgi:5-formyltetrahydrofolate cyclo-ligase
VNGIGKRAMREAAVAARSRLPAGERAAASRAIQQRLVGLEPFRRAATVGLYAPMGAEVDTTAIALAAALAGKRLAYPRLLEGGAALGFASCSPDEFVPAAMGTREPPPGAPEVAAGEIDLLVVPGVAFDLQCRRLGRGRAFYDAALAALPRTTLRVGLAFEVQIVPSVPEEPHDQPVDAVVTEVRVILRATDGGAVGSPFLV